MKLPGTITSRICWRQISDMLKGDQWLVMEDLQSDSLESFFWGDIYSVRQNQGSQINVEVGRSEEDEEDTSCSVSLSLSDTDTHFLQTEVR